MPRQSPAQVIVFGSHARGGARDGTDLDILVIERDVTNPGGRDGPAARCAAAAGRAVPVDIIVVSEAHAAKWGRPRGRWSTPRWTRAGSLPSPERSNSLGDSFARPPRIGDAVEILAASDRAADGVVRVHAQQAVEKFVKAVLTVRGIDAPRTHDLRFLLDCAVAAGLQVPDAARDVGLADAVVGRLPVRATIRSIASRRGAL